MKCLLNTHIFVLAIAAVILGPMTAVAADAPATQAPEQRAGATGIRVLKDVSYGPYGERNLMDFYLPAPTDVAVPHPVVICIHGGGWAGGGKGVYAALGQALAQKGFVAVSITYRFAPAWHSPTQMDDVERAVRWLRKNAKQYELDPQRFGAIGGSAGGHLASYLALTDTRDNGDPDLAGFSSKVQCAVDCYGPVDLVGMMNSASAPLVQSFLGKPLAGNEEDYRKASPITYVSKNPPPFLIMHGTNDLGTARGQVPIEQSMAFAEKLKAAGGDATLIKVEGAGHGFPTGGQTQYGQQTLPPVIEFFTKHLMGEDAPR
jgi:acetyl esterase/lipase